MATVPERERSSDGSLASATSEPEADWYAEIEFRRYLRDKVHFNEADRQFIPTAPDPKRANDAVESDYKKFRELHGRLKNYLQNNSHDYTTVENDTKYPHLWNLDWRDPEGVEVRPDKVIVTAEKVEEIPDGELEEWVIKNVLDGMFVRTNRPNSDNEVHRERVKLGTVSDNFGEYKIGYDTLDNEIYSNFDETASFSNMRDIDAGIRFVHDPRPVYVQVPPEHGLNKLQNVWEDRRRQGRDLKMIITARDAATGTGKTTLAVALAKSWDSEGWDASKATLSPSEYVSRYTELNSGEILIGDEMEQMADPRRSMSKQNVTLTQYWSTMRQWEVSTIATLPSAAMVDKRLRELMDIRINVIERGIAIAYKKKIDDHSGEIKEKRLHRIRWDPLDEDPDYRELARMKKEHMENFNETAYFLAEEEEEDSLTPEEAKRQFRNETIRKMAEGDYSQKEIAGLFDLSRPRISQIVNGGDNE